MTERGGRVLMAAIVACLAGAGPHARGAESRDDNYRFLPKAGEERRVTLTPIDGGVAFGWTGPARASWATALLGLRVGAEDAEPWVEMSAGSIHARQYLDPQARGLRWLNLSDLHDAVADGVSVEIKGHGVTIEAGSGRLRVFAAALDLGKPILILAPHPDDAEIAAFGLYAGRNATIVTVTSGNAGDANYQASFGNAAEQYLFKGYLRAVDSVTVPWQGGIPPERCFNLGYFDARLETMHGRPGEAVPEMYGPNQDVAPYRRANIGHLLPTGSRTNSWAHLVEDLAEVLRKVKPAIVVMPFPQLDTHADHEFVAVAAVEALARSKQAATFLLYTNHAFENLYPFGPAGTVMSLPPWSGRELPVEGVYSHRLSPELQRRKLYALETMHDLRLAPSEQASCGDPAAPRRPDYPRVPSVDYFRRGPRAQETFFVFSRDGVRDLVRAFLAERSPATPGPQ